MMDARLVWDTWRKILADDWLVGLVTKPEPSSVIEPYGLSAAELTILRDYATTPLQTDTNIGMYRRGLVRNALAALSFVPLTRRLLYLSGCDVEAVAADFTRSMGYLDHGPNFWRIAGGFVEYLASREEFSVGSWQDVLALDATAIALARRLGGRPVATWPDDASRGLPGLLHASGEEVRFVASGAAVVATTRYDLTPWLENADTFDVEAELVASPRFWLVYFPAIHAAPTYAELSQRAARLMVALSSPKTAGEISLILDPLPLADVHEMVDSLAQLGVVLHAKGHAPLAFAEKSDGIVDLSRSHSP